MYKTLSTVLIVLIVASNSSQVIGQKIFSDPKLLQKFCGKNVDTSALVSSLGSCAGNVSDQTMFSKCVTGSPTDMLSQICKSDSRAKIINCLKTEMRTIKDQKTLRELNKSGQSLLKCLQSSGKSG